MKKKGFTLVELVGVIILLGVIALIAYPVVTGTINNAKQKSYEETIRQIEYAASRYAVENVFDLPMDGNTVTQITISQLINLGYIQKTEGGKLYNPIDNSELTGCVLIQYDMSSEQYLYKYSEECTGEIVEVDREKPTVSLNVSGSKGNNDWYKQAIVTISSSDNVSVKQIKYCQGVNCTPNQTVNSPSKNITIENSETMICAIAIDTNNNESNKRCTETIKADTIAPIFSGVSDVVINKDSSFDINNGVSVTDSGSGLSGTYTVTPETIDTSVVGTKELIYTAIDNAGNTQTVKRKVIVDADAPKIDFEALDVTPVNGWYNEAFYVKMTIQDNSGTGIKESYTCISTSSSECIPTTSLNELEKSFYIETQGSNRMCVKTIDNNNKATTLCSDIYKLDAVSPTITAKSEKVVIAVGENNESSLYFNTPTYSISGTGNISCTPPTTANLTSGNHEITCIVTGNNGLQASDSVTVIAVEQLVNYTMLYDAGDECTSLTGGWVRYGYNSGVFQKNADHIYATGVGNSKNTNGFGTNNAIDVTSYSKLHYLISMSNAIYTSDKQYFTWWNANVASGKFDGNYDNRVKYLVAEYQNNGIWHNYNFVGLKLYYPIDVSSVNQSVYPTLQYTNWGTSSTFGLSMYSLFMTKADNYTELATIAGLSAATISEILTESSIILNNENAVKYMLTQCTGDYMAAAIQSETFKTSLESSPYKDMIYANTHWAKFLNMVQ